MTNKWLLVTGAIGAATSGGVLYGFSSFIMRSLERLPTSDAIAAMQSINREAPTPSFMVPLFGTTALGVWLGIDAVRDLEQPGSKWQLAGAVMYGIGSLITIAFNVPRNDALARLTPTSANATSSWTAFVTEWSAGNHVRTLACLGAATAWMVALAQRAT